MEVLQFIEDEFTSTFSISVDCSFATSYPHPPRISGHIPDVYAKKIIGQTVIIGEAKTPIDLESPRTKEQLTAFIKYLDKYQNSIIVLAARWSSINSAKSIVRSIFRRHQITNVTAHYIDSYQ